MGEYEKTQWHPPFCAAVKLELRANKKDLNFNTEHTLNTKSIQIDLLVIKKTRDVKIENEIGRIFEGHNIFEYKSPKDALGIDEYFKTLAYACLYKANCPKTDSIKAEDVTISLVREGIPRELIKWFIENGCEVIEKFPGIHYIIGRKIIFPTQIIVSSKLNEAEHQWLKALTKKMSMETGERLILSARDLSEKEDKDNADSVLQLALSENKNIFKALREDSVMCEALKTLMKPELDAATTLAKNEGRSEGRAEGVTELSTVVKRLKKGTSEKALVDEGFSEAIIKSARELLDELS